MKKRLLVTLLAGVLTCGMLTGCGSNSDTTGDSGDSSSSGSGKAITLVLSQRDEWLSSLDTAAQSAAKDAGYTMTSQDALSDSSKQIQYVSTAASAGEEAVIVNLVDPNVAGDIIEAAGDMKVVFVNRPPEDMSLLNENAVYVGSDEMTSGYYQGEWLAEHFKEEGKTEIKYILLNGILGQVSTTNRTASVLQALEDNGITATEASAPLACDYDRAEAMTQITPLLSSGVEFDCIISNNDAMAIGAIEALENAGMDPSSVPIVGIDATADGVQAVKDGKMAMTVFQNAVGQGTAAMQVAANMVAGNDIAEGTGYEVDEENAYVIWVPFEPVTPENVADYE
ncbi:MAG: substrate-binding domain-containing protein [Lachnospiraceae bacterium]